MRYKAVLFDFDGTLTPSLPLWLLSFKNSLLHFGITPASDAEIIEHCFYRAWNDVCDHYQISDKEGFSAKMDAELLLAYGTAVLHPFAYETLVNLKNKGYQLALVTSSPKPIIDVSIVHMDIQKLFDFIITGSEVVNHKPHAEPILKSLKVLNCDPVQALMVGDSSADVMAGKAAGTHTALYTCENHHKYNCQKSLFALEPNYHITCHSMLMSVV